jgi:hypothetical protein
MVCGRPSALRILLLTIACAGTLAGGVRVQIREGRPVVDGVYVNGHGPFRFLLDTGTNVNLIETGLARKIGMGATFDVELRSAAGSALTKGSDENEIALGPVHAVGQKFLLSGMEAIHHALPDVRGVLGQWFLAGFDYRLDLRGQRLEFGKQDIGGNRAEFRMLNGRTAVSTSLGDLVLDSGAARLVLFGVIPDGGERRELLTVAGSKRVGMVASKLTIEGHDVWRGSAVAMPDKAEPGIAGLMPLNLFSAIYVCNSEGYVVFE